MTLLESATAQYFHAEKSKFVKPVELNPPPRQSETNVKSPVEYIFEACLKELEEAYQKAVKSNRPPKFVFGEERIHLGPSRRFPNLF